MCVLHYINSNTNYAGIGNRVFKFATPKTIVWAKARDYIMSVFLIHMEQIWISFPTLIKNEQARNIANQP